MGGVIRPQLALLGCLKGGPKMFFLYESLIWFILVAFVMAATV